MTWSSPTALPGTDPYENTFPRLLPTSNGSLWLVWQKLITTYNEIYLMTYNGYGWSGETPLLNADGAYDDITPTIAQLTNGTIIMIWSRGVPGTGGCYANGYLYSLYVQSYSNGRWTSPNALVQTPDNNAPALTRLKDGRLFLVWYRCSRVSGTDRLYYKTFNGTWSPETLLNGGSGQNKLPSVTQSHDGRIWVFYTATANGAGQLYDTVWNGTAWTSPAQFTSTATLDNWSSVTEDRNGTLWVFWARFLANGTQNGQPSYQYDLFYKNSTTLGASWSADQSVAPNINSDDQQPFVVQNSDKKLWLVYSSDQRVDNPYGSPNLYLVTSPIVKIHDPTLASLSTPTKHLRSGETVDITVQVTNEGDYSETPQVNYYANTTLVNTGQITVVPGQSVPLTVSWLTGGRKPGSYTLNATLLPVKGQLSRLNTSIASRFFLLPAGDVNRDGTVDITDLVNIAFHSGASFGSPRYDPDADLNGDGIIDITDITICGASIGQSIIAPDLALVSIDSPKTSPRIGEVVTLRMQVSNLGYSSATSRVSVYLNQIPAGTIPLSLSPGQATTLSLTFNSMGYNYGRYAITAVIAPTLGELNESNNSLNSTLILVPPGDVNRDGTVEISDLTIMASHFGSFRGTSNYYPDADLNNDGAIDATDLTLCAVNFGKTIF